MDELFKNEPTRIVQLEFREEEIQTKKGTKFKVYKAVFDPSELLGGQVQSASINIKTDSYYFSIPHRENKQKATAPFVNINKRREQRPPTQQPPMPPTASRVKEAGVEWTSGKTRGEWTFSSNAPQLHNRILAAPQQRLTEDGYNYWLSHGATRTFIWREKA